MEANCMLKIFYTTLWKQSFQCKNGKRKHGTVGKLNNLRIMIVGKKLKNN